MVNADLMAAKLADLRDRLDRVRAHRRTDAAALNADRDALDLVSFNLMLAVQICADIASHLIADESWPVAKNLAQSFLRLRDQGVIQPTTTDALVRAVGLRNVVAHGYGAIDASMVHEASTRGLEDLERFAQQVASWTRSRTS